MSFVTQTEGRKRVSLERKAIVRSVPLTMVINIIVSLTYGLLLLCRPTITGICQHIHEVVQVWL